MKFDLHYIMYQAVFVELLFQKKRKEEGERKGEGRVELEEIDDMQAVIHQKEKKEYILPMHSYVEGVNH